MRMYPVLSANGEYTLRLASDDGSDNPFACLPGLHSEQCHAILLGVDCSFVHSEFHSHAIDINIRSLFGRATRGGDDDPASNCISISCSPGSSTRVHRQERVRVYSATARASGLTVDDIQCYAGCESAFDTERYRADQAQDGDGDGDDWSVFNETHPVVAFVQTHADALGVRAGVDIAMGTDTLYQIKDACVLRACEAMHFSVYKYIRYTRFEDTHVVCNLSEDVQDTLRVKAKRIADGGSGAMPCVCVTLEMDYIAVEESTPGSAPVKLTRHLTQLK